MDTLTMPTPTMPNPFSCHPSKMHPFHLHQTDSKFFHPSLLHSMTYKNFFHSVFDDTNKQIEQLTYSLRLLTRREPSRLDEEYQSRAPSLFPKSEEFQFKEKCGFPVPQQQSISKPKSEAGSEANWNSKLEFKTPQSKLKPKPKIESESSLDSDCNSDSESDTKAIEKLFEIPLQKIEEILLLSEKPHFKQKSESKSEEKISFDLIEADLDTTKEVIKRYEEELSQFILNNDNNTDNYNYNKPGLCLEKRNKFVRNLKTNGNYLLTNAAYKYGSSNRYNPYNPFEKTFRRNFVNHVCDLVISANSEVSESTIKEAESVCENMRRGARKRGYQIDDLLPLLPPKRKKVENDTIRQLNQRIIEFLSKLDTNNLNELKTYNLSELNTNNLSELDTNNLSESNNDNSSESNNDNLSESNNDNLSESNNDNLSESNNDSLSESNNDNLSEPETKMNEDEDKKELPTTSGHNDIRYPSSNESSTSRQGLSTEYQRVRRHSISQRRKAEENRRQEDIMRNHLSDHCYADMTARTKEEIDVISPSRICERQTIIHQMQRDASVLANAPISRRGRGRPPGRNSVKRKRITGQMSSLSVSSPVTSILKRGRPQKKTKRSSKNRNENQEQKEKRKLHNTMERQRRIHLKNEFNQLRKRVPIIANNEKASKVSILNNARDYILQLISTSVSFDPEIDQLKKRQESLKIKIQELIEKQNERQEGNN
ncbi:protein PFC0760c isoform X2 [Pogonomyrmex barbatus]|uniref:Protein PFC0760c isoform X2 n=1 Tax=Pogonomyrmex barbatus TaxID=144034 RepID=A0A6I9WMQ5_9HYME|nr:protein PFC0760c isoform X2 [Pogonomyrmex barbatus]